MTRPRFDGSVSLIKNSPRNFFFILNGKSKKTPQKFLIIGWPLKYSPLYIAT